MATITANSSHNSNFKERITYTAGNGTITITKIEGWRSDGYTTQEIRSGLKIYLYDGGTLRHTISVPSLDWKANSVATTHASGSWSFSGDGNHTINIRFGGSYVTNIQNASFTYTVNAGTYVYPAPTNVSVGIRGQSRTGLTLSRNWSGATSCSYNIDGQGWQTEGSTLNGIYCNADTVSGLTPNKQYSVQIAFNNHNSPWTYSNTAYGTTTGNAPSTPSVSTTPSRTTCSFSISSSYDTNASFESRSIRYGTSTSYGKTSTGTSLSGLSPNTTYYYSVTVTDNWNRTSGAKTGSFKTTGNNPVINSTGATPNQTGAQMAFSASYDTNDSLSSYSWRINQYYFEEEFTFNNTNTVTGLRSDTPYAYELTVSSSEGRTDKETGSFTTYPTTQQIDELALIDVTTTSVVVDTKVTNPSFLNRVWCGIYLGDVLIQEKEKTADIAADNSFTFEGLEPGTSYIIKSQIRTNGNYDSSIVELEITTTEDNIFTKINSDGTIVKHKAYALGKGNIYNAKNLTWQSGYYETGTIGQDISFLRTEVVGATESAASSVNHIEVMPNQTYEIRNEEEDVTFIIHGTNSSDEITSEGHLVSPGETYSFLGSDTTTRLYISARSSSNPYINTTTIYFFTINIFKTVPKTEILKDGVVVINGKIRYIDIIQAGSSENEGSHIIELEVYNEAGDNIALNKTVSVIKGKNNGTEESLLKVTNGDHSNVDEYLSISGVSANDRQTIVRVDLGQEYTDVSYIKLWRYYNDGRTYNDTAVYGRDATTQLTWKFHSFRIQGTYPETEEGATFNMNYASVIGFPMITSVTLDPSTETVEGVNIIIDSEVVVQIPPVINSLISYRTDAVLAANQGRELKNDIGDLTELTTEEKSSIVEAINELWNNINFMNSAGNTLEAVLNAILNT